MLLIAAGVLIVLWLIGFLAHIGGGLIHIVLVIAAIVFIYHLLTRKHAN
jgi:4-hydroxybenzoate polyprenyltransferase